MSQTEQLKAKKSKKAGIVWFRRDDDQERFSIDRDGNLSLNLGSDAFRSSFEQKLKLLKRVRVHQD